MHDPSKRPASPGTDEILASLARVKDPDLGRDIVSLGFVKNLRADEGDVSFDLELTTPACPVRDLLKRQCEEALLALPGVRAARVNLTSRVRQAPRADEKVAIAGVRNVVAVASGKGGVGKSTVSANLALALAATGARVGLLDADIYGPNIPMMFGLSGRLQANDSGGIIPHERYGISVVSIGFFLEADRPVIWRGPMVHGVIRQFLTQVEWGEKDYLVVDLPPGTGDAQITLAQEAPLSGAVIVTTPQDVSLADARKALAMFRQLGVPVLGIVENMSYFLCGHCGGRTEIFKHGGGERVAAELGLPFLGHIPLDPEVVTSSDEGTPILLRRAESAAAGALRQIAGRVAARLSMESFEGEAGAEAEGRLERGT